MTPFDGLVRVRRRVIPFGEVTLNLGWEYQLKMGYAPNNVDIVPIGGYEDYGTGQPYKLNPINVTVFGPPHSIAAIQDEVHRGPPYRTGGSLRIVKAEPMYDPGTVYAFKAHDSHPIGTEFHCGFYAPEEYWWNTGDLFTNSTAVSLTPGLYFPDLSSWGDKAYAKLKPKLSGMSGFQAIFESRDIPRMLKTTSGGLHSLWKATKGSNPNPKNVNMQTKAAADHYINHQFGWRPFISDLSDLNNLMNNAKTMLAKLSAENGKWTKRRVSLHTERTSEMVNGGETGNSCPALPSAIQSKYLDGNCRWELWEDKTTRIYATGEFTFYRPEFDQARLDYNTAWSTIQRLLVIHGVRINPSTIWKVVPWSWLIDWVSNIGAHIEHLADTVDDAVVGRNMYVMRQYTMRKRLVCIVPFRDGTTSFEFVRKIETKQRDTFGSPYGFSLSWDNLTPKQLAILAALVISRKGPSRGIR